MTRPCCARHAGLSPPSSMASPFDLTGQDIWVIGGAGYLGQAVVTQLASLGARVLCADLGDRAKVFVQEKSLAANVTGCALDAGDSSAVSAFVSAQLAQRGVPHGLVNQAYATTAKK